MNDHIVTVGDHDISLDLEDGDVVADVLVLARVLRLDSPGDSILVIGMGESTDHIVAHGLIGQADARMREP